MKAQDLLELAGRNLRESVLRNSLTTMGISVGIASLVALLSLGIGLQTLATKRLGRSGLFDIIMVTNRDVRIAGPQAPPRNQRANEPRRPLDETARKEIAALPNVAEVYADVRFPSQVRLADAPPLAPKDYGSRQMHTLIVSGVPQSSSDREAFTTMKGSFFSAPDAAEAILQSESAKSVFERPEDELGKTIIIRYAQQQVLPGGARQVSAQEAAAASGGDAEMMLGMMGFQVVPKELKLKVVGVTAVNPEAGTRGAFGSGIFIPQKLAEQADPMRPGQLQPGSPVYGDQYTALVVRMKKPENVEVAEDKIKALGFGAFSLMDASRSIRQVFIVIDGFLLIFGSLALIVASLGIINTLVMAILERRREIGVMKAIGASDGDVQKLFFAEAGAMGVLGGALGVLIGWLIGKIINFATAIYVQRQQGVTPDNIWYVPWWLVLFAIGFSLLVSLIAGLYPARRAARLDPVQALRYE